MNSGEHKDQEGLVKQEDLPEGVVLRDHVVDGIQEYDQSMPFWWLCILFSMIAFSIVYWLVLNDRSFSGGSHTRVDHQLKELQAKRLASSIDVSNDDLFWEMSQTPSFVSAGQATFEANCIQCHGKDLKGGIGFNLVDSEWVHGGNPSEIYVTITNGVPSKGMPAWGSTLGQKRVTEVIAYVLSKNPGLQEANAQKKLSEQ
jgi:cytochrome c oxidase cbb3-type subunit 3